MPIDRIKHAAVGHEKQSSRRMFVADVLDEVDDPRMKLRERFPTWQSGILLPFAPDSAGVRLVAFRFRRREALQHAEMTFAQLRCARDGLWLPLRDRRCSPVRANQVTRINGMEFLDAQMPADGIGLRKADVIQWDVQMPLNAAFGIPRGFAMADKDQLRRQPIAFVIHAMRHNNPFKYSPSGKASDTG